MYYDFIIPIVLRVSDVAHGLLVFIANHINSNSKIEVLYCYKKNFNVFMKVFLIIMLETLKEQMFVYWYIYDHLIQVHRIIRCFRHQIVPFLIKVPIE